MIATYYRPQTLDEVIKLLSQPNTLPLGGGTLLSKSKTDSVSVVDLQALGLNHIHKKGNNLEVGATVTLQQLFESEHASDALKATLKLEAPLNIRNAATVAGTLVACDGRSALASAMLALDAKIIIQPNDEESLIGNLLPLRTDQLGGKLITKIIIPLNARLTFEYVSRTPADKPIISAALVQWPSGRTRLVIGGFGKLPTLAMDGTEPEGIEVAARNACHAATDEWASAEYRMSVAATLAKRASETVRS